MIDSQTYSAIEKVVSQIVEASKKPGVMSLAGQQAEARCTRHLKVYFKLLGARIKLAHFENLVELTNKDAAKHAAEMKARQIVRRASDVLGRILKVNYHEALLVAYKQVVVSEADSPATVGPASGLLSSDAEAYAAEQAAKQIVGINQTTVDDISELVADAVSNQATPADLGRDIRDLVASMTKNRSDLIARTEMADAFGAAAMMKLERESISYKQLITSPDACPICQSIEDAGPVPTDEPFVDEDGEAYDRSPIHPACRCATVGARAPLSEAGVDDEARDDHGRWTAGSLPTKTKGVYRQHQSVMFDFGNDEVAKQHAEHYNLDEDHDNYAQHKGTKVTFFGQKFLGKAVKQFETKESFDPNEPRDEKGEWTATVAPQMTKAGNPHPRAGNSVSHPTFDGLSTEVKGYAKSAVDVAMFRGKDEGITKGRKTLASLGLQREFGQSADNFDKSHPEHEEYRNWLDKWERGKK